MNSHQRSWTRFMTIVAVAAAVTVHAPTAVLAQEAAPVDSAKQAEAIKAMEAAADSARKANERRASGANRGPRQQARDTTKATVTDSAAAADAPKAAEDAAGSAVKVLESKDSAVDTSASDTSRSAATTPATPTGDTAIAQQPPPEPTVPEDPTAPYKNVVFAPGEKPVVSIETSLGKIVVELWPDVAVTHCQNFVYLANKGFYDSLTFHRVVPGFLIQGGDPQGSGMGTTEYTLPAEFSASVLFEEGILGMARRSDPDARGGAAERPEYLNSAGSQFFICLGRAASLDGKYTAFGKVIQGLDIVHKIAKVPAQRERPAAPVYMTKVTVQPKI